MRVEFEVPKDNLRTMIWAVDDLLDYYGCCPSEYPMDQEVYNDMEGLELAQAAYMLGSILRKFLEEAQ